MQGLAGARRTVGMQAGERGVGEAVEGTPKKRAMNNVRVFSAEDVRHACHEQKIRSLQLQFTDILGIVKHLDLPCAQLDKILAGDVMFDGSAIEGFVRLQESDMYLRADPATFCILPWKTATARLICDVVTLGGDPYPGDPRYALRRVLAEAGQLGYSVMIGPEVEFFLYRLDGSGKPSTHTNDIASYFDLAPGDAGAEIRETIVDALEDMGFGVASCHHEAAPGQHEIDLRYADALTMADRLVTLRILARAIAVRRGMYATFMPKPASEVNGSGLHLHQSLFTADGSNAFCDARRPEQLSTIAHGYLAGLLAHAKSFTAITNPLINSYKRLVPGYEAPTIVTWSHRDHSPLIRVPSRRGLGTRLEIRSPDPSCNPYLAFAVLIKAGLDGMQRRLEPPPQVVATAGLPLREDRERAELMHLPSSLEEALQALEQDPVMREALGEAIFRHFVNAKRIEWDYYRRQVHAWEVEQYLSTF